MLRRRALLLGSVKPIGALREDGVQSRAFGNRQALYSALSRLLRSLVFRGRVEERGMSRALMVHLTDAGRGVLDGFDAQRSEIVVSFVAR